MSEPFGCLLSALVLDRMGRETPSTHVKHHKEITFTSDTLQLLRVGIDVVASDNVAELVRDFDFSSTLVLLADRLGLLTELAMRVGSVVEHLMPKGFCFVL